MRIRSVKPEFWSSQKMGRVSRDARLVFVGLWSMADDHGRFPADVRLIAGQLLPFDSDREVVVTEAVAALRAEGAVVLYAVGRDVFGLIPAWKDHQRIDKPSQPKYPAPPPEAEQEASRRVVEASRVLPEPSRILPPGREGKGEERKGGEGIPPPPPIPAPAVDPNAEIWMPEAVDPPNKFADSGAFEEWFQFKRGEAGYLREKRSSAVSRGKWWTEVHVALNGDPTALEFAAIEFAKDPHWEAATPPMPFVAFMSQWRKYIPRRVA